MRKLFFAAFFTVSAALPFYLLAGTVGKVAGTVIDAETKQPLLGVNVFLKNTTMGAVTDADGDFFIINVPVGTYTVIASMIGYQQVEKTEVRVTIDLTTRVNFGLVPEAIAGPAVEIVAERPMVERDVTVKKTVMDAQQIRSTPVRDLTELLTLTSGVVQVKYASYGIPGWEDRGLEQIHVRGGRSGEISYMIDGMYIRNPLYGGIGKGTRLNKYAAEEVTQETGVFNAEYGDALSSVVNTVTRTGNFERYNGTLHFGTSQVGGKWLKSNDFFLPSHLEGYKDAAGSFSGPLPLLKKRAAFFVSGQRTRSRYRTLEFDDDVYNPDDPLNHADPKDLTPGWMAFGFDNTDDIFGKLTFKFGSTMKLALSGWWVNSEFQVYNDVYRFYDRSKNFNRKTSDRQALEWTHQLSPRTYYTLRLARFWQQMRIRSHNLDGDGDGFPDWLESKLGYNPNDNNRRNFRAVPPDSDGDGYPDEVEDNPRLIRTDVSQAPTDSRDPNSRPDLNSFPLWNENLLPFQYTTPSGYPPYFTFAESGADRYFHRSFSETYEGRFDVVNQLTKQHQLQAGFDFKQHEILFDEVQLPWLETPFFEDYNYRPWEAAIYLQDKMEYPWMTINAGIRLDMNNNRALTFVDPLRPDLNGNLIYGDRGDPARGIPSDVQDAKMRYRISPRLGFSHVITSRATFTFGYGHFYQNPIYRNVYLNLPRYGNNGELLLQTDVTTPSPIVGNAAILAEKLIAYEFGVKNQFSDDWAISFIGWSKEYSSLSATERVPSFPYSFTTSRNFDYGSARGVDVILEKRGAADNLWLDASYTYSVAKANRADPWEGYRNTDTPETQPKREILMPYDRTHDFNIRGGYKIPEGKGPALIGGRPLSNLKFDFVYFAQSGAPYTPIVNEVPGATNSERLPWIHQVNLRFSKTMRIAGLKYSFGCLIDNLFDRKNVIDIYPRTGRPDDPGQRARTFIRNYQNSTTVYDQPGFYGPRRSVQFVTEIDF
ncbi:TonB-dependent receptor [candidate division KSB1 bacterium]|nr:TonB-dependent receptor [candidate division KSB1 bacterium]